MTEGHGRYILGDRESTEIGRLGFQHEVWRESTDLLLARAGLAPGHVVLDAGCGPGFLSLDLATRVGPRGRVLAVDSSPGFIDHLRVQARQRGADNVEATVADARRLPLRAASLDGAVARWLLMFLDDPEAVVAGIARALRSGGVLGSMEYVQFRSMSLWPPTTSFETIYAAVHELIRRNGGDADVGGRVPELAARQGLKVEAIIPVWRVGRPGSPLWRWLDQVNENHGNLVAAGLVARETLDRYHAEWAERAAEPQAFFTAPPVLLTVARKP